MASGSKKVIYAALVGNALIAITKFIAAAMTGSSAMLSEGIHSVVDTGNQVLLLLGIKRSQKIPDEKFPFGYGKEVYFWSFIVAILIFAVGSGISLYEGIVHILHPSEITNPKVNYIVLGFALVFEGAAWLMAFKEFKRSKGNWGYFEAVQRGKDPSMFVVLFEDSAAMLGLIIAFLGVALGHLTGIPYFDGVASVLIGLLLGGTAIWLAYETKGLLIGESANPRVVSNIKELLFSHPEIENINEVLTLHMGPQYILVTISADFKDDLTSNEIERVVARIDQDLRQAYPRIKRVFVEAEAKPSITR